MPPRATAHERSSAATWGRASTARARAGKRPPGRGDSGGPDPAPAPAALTLQGMTFQPEPLMGSASGMALGKETEADLAAAGDSEARGAPTQAGTAI